MKATLEQLFKDGENFKFNKVYYSSDEIAKEIDKVKKQQEKVIESSKVNLNNLRKITFDI